MPYVSDCRRKRELDEAEGLGDGREDEEAQEDDAAGDRGHGLLLSWSDGDLRGILVL